MLKTKTILVTLKKFRKKPNSSCNRIHEYVEHQNPYLRTKNIVEWAKNKTHLGIIENLRNSKLF